jgi:hypothetical protein
MYVTASYPVDPGCSLNISCLLGLNTDRISPLPFLQAQDPPNLVAAYAQLAMGNKSTMEE